MPWAVVGLVWRGTAGSFHHRLWLGQREAFTGQKTIKVTFIDLTLLISIQMTDFDKLDSDACEFWLIFWVFWHNEHFYLNSPSRKPWLSMSQIPAQCTSMCCQCTATVASRAKALSCCGGTCSTCAVCRASAELCWFARTSWCPSTSRPDSRRKGHQPSLYPTCNSKRWSTRSAGKRMHDETAAASQSTPTPPLIPLTHL